MTPQPHDFKAVAEEVEKVTDKTGWPYQGSICSDKGMILNPDEVKTIRFALRLAERVCNPSAAMYEAGSQSLTDSEGFYHPEPDEKAVFKAMISEALKEIENG